MGVAIGTSVFVELERRSRELVGGLGMKVTDDVFISALVVAELWIGVELADSAERRSKRLQKIEALLKHGTVLPFDEEVAPTYARIYAALRRARTPIPANDLAIAALSVHHGHEILVGPGDEQHFRSVPGLKVRVLGRNAATD